MTKYEKYQSPDKIITVDEVLSFHPCLGWTKQRILDLTGGRQELKISEILDLDIDPKNLLWVLLRPECLAEHTLHSLACDYAEDVLRNFESGCPDDKRPRKAIEVKRLWLDGKATDEELSEAESAAWSARSAVWSARSSAAWSAEEEEAAWSAGISLAKILLFQRKQIRKYLTT